VSTGEIKTRKLLTGKGRQRPYRMLIRALDKGQPSLSSDAPLDIYISDVASNDGVPIFLRPMPNETAFVAEVCLFLFLPCQSTSLGCNIDTGKGRRSFKIINFLNIR
jgi:hypothetical protein